MQTYRTKAGRIQYRPADAQLMDIIEGDNNAGFCLACGEEIEGIEPDAAQYTCPHCHREKVYGAEELLSMGIYYDSDREADINQARAQGFIR